MLLKSQAALAAMISVALCPATHAAAVTSACWRADEARASRVQALQTMLMVDAIKCQDTIPETLASYNVFMNTRHDMIVANKYMVQAYFVRTLGPVDGAKASTDNDTLVANRLSSDAIDVRRCETSGMYARAAAQATDEDLLTMATILTKDADVEECPVANIAAARPAAMIIPVWKKPTSTLGSAASAQPSGTLPGAAVPVSLASSAGLIAATSPAMVTPSAAVPASGVATVDDRAETLKALQAAVIALTQVASSLAPSASGVASQEN